MITFKMMFVSIMASLGFQQDPLINQDQLYCMSEAIYYEAGNQSTRGKVGVANVIDNRSKTPKNKGNVCGVVAQKGQFSYHNIKHYKLRSNHPATEESVKKSIMISYLSLKHRLPDITGGALYYLNPHTATDLSWMNKFTLTAVIDDHHFYKNVKES